MSLAAWEGAVAARSRHATAHRAKAGERLIMLGARGVEALGKRFQYCNE